MLFQTPVCSLSYKTKFLLIKIAGIPIPFVIWNYLAAWKWSCDSFMIINFITINCGTFHLFHWLTIFVNASYKIVSIFISDQGATSHTESIFIMVHHNPVHSFNMNLFQCKKIICFETSRYKLSSSSKFHIFSWFIAIKSKNT
jgi:hypothetical protein